jgi:hypothetical protein
MILFSFEKVFCCRLISVYKAVVQKMWRQPDNFLRKRGAAHHQQLSAIRRIPRDIDQLIVPSGLGTRSGVLGAMALAIGTGG